MATRYEIVEYLDNFLNVSLFRDYCPNGLQVEGCSEINTLVSGVTASQALVDRATALNADAILVHHGYFWKGENETITGMKQRRIKALLQADINLLAYHLPLDSHSRLGNNAQLAQVLGIQSIDRFDHNGVKNLIWRGELEQEMRPDQLAGFLAERLGREPQHLPSLTPKAIRTVAWCTGGAQGYIEQAAELGVDAYISGEVSEQTFHQARELDIHYFAAGHHATERHGVKALGEHLAEKFAINVHFEDIENPV